MKCMLRNWCLEAAGRGYLNHRVCNCTTEHHSYGAKPQAKKKTVW